MNVIILMNNETKGYNIDIFQGLTPRNDFFSSETWGEEWKLK